MRNRIALALAAAFALSACNMFGGGGNATENESETNKAAAEEETKDGNSSRDEEAGSDRSERSDRGDERRSGSEEESADRGAAEDQASSGRGADENLRRQLLAGVRRQRDRLPMREGPGTVTDMEVEGTQLVVTMEMDDDFGEAEWDQMAAALQRNLCGDTGSRRMIDRGATVLYRITDADGERRSMITNSCG